MGSRWDNFPAGLKVLVVDDDATTLKIVGKMLESCSYHVTPCQNAQEALTLLRDRTRSEFDLVLSDVYMPDMDGFRLLELIGLEMDLPVIMMSSNGETNVVLRGVTHGAVDFLIKPVRIEELRNLWQHVVRRRRDLVKEADSEEHSQEKDEGATESSRKRKDVGLAPGEFMERLPSMQDEDNTASKKPRVVWSVEMHQQFVNAVNQLGIDKAVPKKILEIMNVEGLTRENVASHLQKYRLYLKRVSGVTSVAPRSKSSAQPQPASATPTSDPGTSGAAAVAVAAGASFPNPTLMNPVAAMMNTAAGLNPLLSAMGPLNAGLIPNMQTPLAGLMPGLSQAQGMGMGLPGLPPQLGLPPLPMGLPQMGFMQGMSMPLPGLPGMGLLPSVQGSQQAPVQPPPQPLPHAHPQQPHVPPLSQLPPGQQQQQQPQASSAGNPQAQPSPSGMQQQQQQPISQQRTPLGLVMEPAGIGSTTGHKAVVPAQKQEADAPLVDAFGASVMPFSSIPLPTAPHVSPLSMPQAPPALVATSASMQACVGSHAATLGVLDGGMDNEELAAAFNELYHGEGGLEGLGMASSAADGKAGAAPAGVSLGPPSEAAAMDDFFNFFLKN